jgi:hypothetical protein
MDGAAAVVSWAAGILGLLILAGLALALIKGSYNRARIEALRSSLDDTDKELARERGRRERLEDRVLHLEAENETLKALVLQRAEVEQLGTTMAGYYAALLANQQKALEILGRLEERS